MERLDDKRGNTDDRHRRQLWLLGAHYSERHGWAPYGGNGSTVPCVHCGVELVPAPNRDDSLTVDRIEPGESYRYENCQPSCHVCNERRGANLQWVGPTGYRPLGWDPGEKVGRKWVRKPSWILPDGSLLPLIPVNARPVGAAA